MVAFSFFTADTVARIMVVVIALFLGSFLCFLITLWGLKSGIKMAQPKR